ncbi:MAG TPA: hypothetical protein VJA21_06420 [Verrucomicrobiae bacterium]
MNQELVTGWLGKWARTQAIMSLLGAVAVFLAGVAVLVLTWALMYMVSLFVLGPWLGYHHWLLSVAGLVVIPLLFWGNARTSREYLSEYEVTTGTASGTVVNFYLPGVGMGSTVNPLAPKTIQTGAKMITDCLYFGPRVVVYALNLWRKSVRLRRLDVPWCGAVLTVLFVARRKLSFQEIVDAVDGLDPTRIFPQLQDIDGVLFLKSDPPGLILGPELKETFLGLARARAGL